MSHQRLPRSPLLMSHHEMVLLIVDMQPKLLHLIDGHQRVTWNNRRLIDGAKLFEIPVLVTEQYPQGLGPTEPSLAERLPQPTSKTTFSCGECGQLFADVAAAGRRRILVAGIETHVCVQQTVLDLLTDGFDVFVAVDAVTARFGIDHQTALGRIELAGATLTTTESALFEWCEHSGADQFKAISGLVRESPPAD